jgi:hypothetical protein
MSWSILQYFALGVVGGMLVDGMEFWQALRSPNSALPPYYRLGLYWLGEAIRLLIGGTLAAIFYASHQVDTPLAAAMIGITAPIIVERLAKAPPALPTAGVHHG